MIMTMNHERRTTSAWNWQYLSLAAHH